MDFYLNHLVTMAQSDPDFQLKCQIIAEVQQRPLLYNKGPPGTK